MGKKKTPSMLPANFLDARGKNLLFDEGVTYDTKGQRRAQMATDKANADRLRNMGHNSHGFKPVDK